jgi:hypothetical protein
MKPFKVGDKVEILVRIRLLQDSETSPFKRQFGTITNINGAYILVRPKWRRWETECYPNELKLIDID